MDDYTGHQATELDSHANMAVAGCDCTIIARSGCFANVTPFHKDLPAMEMVEIGDVMVAYGRSNFAEDIPDGYEECIADS